MKLKVQKRLAAQLFKASPKRVWFDEERLDDIKEAITKQDIKRVIAEGAIRLKPIKSISRGRIRLNKIQKSGGKRKGHGSRKGGAQARHPGKDVWMAKIRVQRAFLKVLRDKAFISRHDYRDLYLKSKGGFFRSRRHIKIYLEEHNITKQTETTPNPKAEKTEEPKATKPKRKAKQQ